MRRRRVSASPDQDSELARRRNWQRLEIVLSVPAPWTAAAVAYHVESSVYVHRVTLEI
jgi:hypothetical protein